MLRRLLERVCTFGVADVVVADDFDRVAGERPFRSLAVVGFGRVAVAVPLAFAGERLWPLLPLVGRAFVCRPANFSDETIGGAFAEEFDDDERGFDGDRDDLNVDASSTCIGCDSVKELSSVAPVDRSDSC